MCGFQNRIYLALNRLTFRHWKQIKTGNKSKLATAAKDLVRMQNRDWNMKSEISPHDQSFLHLYIGDRCDKYQVEHLVRMQNRDNLSPFKGFSANSFFHPNLDFNTIFIIILIDIAVEIIWEVNFQFQRT